MGYTPASKWAAQKLKVYWYEIWKHMWVSVLQHFFFHKPQNGIQLWSHAGCTQGVYLLLKANGHSPATRYVPSLFLTNRWGIFIRGGMCEQLHKEFALACKQFLFYEMKKSTLKMWHKPENYSLWKLLLMWLIKTSWHLGLLTASLSHEWLQWSVCLRKLTKKEVKEPFCHQSGRKQS
jgi:hypothetical protein